jgi:hypothetical protein
LITYLWRGFDMGGLFGGGGGPDMSGQMEAQRAENARLKEQADEERRELAEQAAGRVAARRRGGSRMLLADTRLTPETGVEQTLGSKGMGV